MSLNEKYIILALLIGLIAALMALLHDIVEEDPHQKFDEEE